MDSARAEDGKIVEVVRGRLIDGWLSFEPGQVVCGMLWDGEALSAPLAEEPAPRRLIAKSLVQERVHAIDKLGIAFAALQAEPILFGRWFAPDWPNVYADDENLLLLLNAIGCTEAEIAEITAP